MHDGLHIKILRSGDGMAVRLVRLAELYYQIKCDRFLHSWRHGKAIHDTTRDPVAKSKRRASLQDVWLGAFSR